jgi:hypothetical protein
MPAIQAWCDASRKLLGATPSEVLQYFQHVVKHSLDPMHACIAGSC